MATTTTNFGWDIPQSTDLVKDGATAIAALGQDIDTAFVDLKGGTTGQVLAKASNTDLDYTWTTPEVGDITAVTAGTGLTGGGTSGAVSLAFDQANYGGGQYAAGKNKIINGDFSIWQRGTSFSNPKGVFTSDRWQHNYDGTGALTISRQSFTLGTAPVTGYEGQYFFRVNQTTAGSGTSFNVSQQPIEDVRTFAGQTVTVSFWAKADAARTVNVALVQTFGTGGSGSVGAGYVDVSVTTSWQRFSATIAVPSIAGKTIGSTDFSALRLFLNFPVNTTFTVDVWGVQVEAGSTATPFQTATGTLQGELAACQRYYWRSSGGAYAGIGSGMATSTTTAKVSIPLPVSMRIVPTAIDFSNVGITDQITATQAATLSIIASNGSLSNPIINADFASAFAAAKPVDLTNNNNTAGYVGLSAEL
jgi:hypothetical protein